MTECPYMTASGHPTKPWKPCGTFTGPASKFGAHIRWHQKRADVTVERAKRDPILKRLVQDLTPEPLTRSSTLPAGPNPDTGTGPKRSATWDVGPRQPYSPAPSNYSQQSGQNSSPATVYHAYPQWHPPPAPMQYRSPHASPERPGTTRSQTSLPYRTMNKQGPSSGPPMTHNGQPLARPANTGGSQPPAASKDKRMDFSHIMS